MKIKAKPFAELDSAKQADGLIPAVIQDDRTLQVLMLGYMNREAYEKSLAEGRVTFYSRTRGCLWTKGETSGNYLDIVSVTADCDAPDPRHPPRPDLPHRRQELLRGGRARNRRLHPLPPERDSGPARRDARRIVHQQAVRPRRE